MKLPNAENAYVPSAKLVEYLLSEIHPIGRAKALFLKNLGYDNTNAGTLERDLLAFAHDISIGETIVSEWGIKYVITSALHTPSGESVYLRTVWIVDQGESRPRFVTAYPD